MARSCGKKAVKLKKMPIHDLLHTGYGPASFEKPSSIKYTVIYTDGDYKNPSIERCLGQEL